MNALVEIADPVDVMVGLKVRAIRHERGMSQEGLARALATSMNRSYSFQQIQKYERGANRVSASTLYHLGKVLKVPVSTFFDETVEYRTKDVPAEMMDWLASAQGFNWMKAGYHLPKPVLFSMLETARAVAQVQP